MSHYAVSYDWRIFELIPDGSDVLDIGFGYGMWGYELKVRRKIKNIVGIEPYKPYCDLVSSFNVYDVIINKDVFDVPIYSLYKSKRIVLCCDVVEHIELGLNIFMDKIESWGDKIIIATPNGNMLNEHEQDGNKLNRHKLWLPVVDTKHIREFFENRGYRVEVVRYYPDAPKIFRPFIKIYNYIRGNRGITSCIIAVKEKYVGDKV